MAKNAEINVDYVLTILNEIQETMEKVHSVANAGHIRLKSMEDPDSHALNLFKVIQGLTGNLKAFAAISRHVEANVKTA